MLMVVVVVVVAVVAVVVVLGWEGQEWQCAQYNDSLTAVVSFIRGFYQQLFLSVIANYDCHQSLLASLS